MYNNKHMFKVLPCIIIDDLLVIRC